MEPSRVHDVLLADVELFVGDPAVGGLDADVPGAAFATDRQDAT